MIWRALGGGGTGQSRVAQILVLLISCKVYLSAYSGVGVGGGDSVAVCRYNRLLLHSPPFSQAGAAFTNIFFSFQTHKKRIVFFTFFLLILAIFFTDYCQKVLIKCVKTYIFFIQVGTVFSFFLILNQEFYIFNKIHFAKR